MSVARLLEDFSKKDTLPVDVNLVLDELRSRGVEDEIVFFHDISLDDRFIKGFLKRDYRIEGGRKIFRSVITYGKSYHAEERLVCCKEMLHILDPENKKSSTPDEVKYLISKIGLPAELVDPIDDDAHSNDRIAMLEAVAILFPLGARNILYEKYITGKLSLEWIAEQAELPIGLVKYAMNGAWPALLERMILRRYREMEIVKAGKIESKKVERRGRRRNSGRKV